MFSVISQTHAVIAMNIRSLPRRLWMSLAMILANAVVVAILLAFLAMDKGFETTLQGAGSDDVALFLRKGSAAELNSGLDRDQVNLIRTAPGIAQDDKGPQVSAELYVIVDGIKKSTGTEANLPLRGLELSGVPLRRNFSISAGRLFTPGTNELVVGRGVTQQFEGFDLGTSLRIGNSEWTVVGEFTTGGNVFESELWADLSVIQNVYNRGSSVQTVRARLTDASQLEAIKSFAENDARLNVDVQTEKDYFSSQSKNLSYMAIFGKVISAVMALGALSGALNTMYTSVADRSKEIATLRTLGFSTTSAFLGTLAESMVLAAIGGLVGALCAFLLFDGLNASTLGGSFTQVVFSFRMTGDLIQQGIQMALVIGFVSGVFPAWRAARMPVLLAFR
ncbi:ABC transporter permease [Simiduia litorea]|uniref:ABC transporter permease n=1 Tax=Simiduia litorea TaxID=1435348 RepID=UPI0036F2EC9D